MTEAGTRFVAFAGSRVRIDYRGRTAGDIVEFLFRDVGDTPDDELHGTFAVDSDDEKNLVVVRVESDVRYQGSSAADAARVLQESTSYALAAASVNGLLMHAGAVSLGGRAVLLPGTSGSGKTTLAARLLLGGFAFLTDELALVLHESRRVLALPRPLNVKAAGRDAVAGLGDAQGWSSLTSTVTTLLQPPAARVLDTIADEQRLVAVVFPRYRTGMTPRLSPLSRSESGLRLMGCLLNARNLPEHGFPAVSAFARLVPAYALEYGDATEAGKYVEEVIEASDRDLR